MDLTKISNVIGYAKPIEMPISELLTGSYHFCIPSYQRGYRWESSEMGVNNNDAKQVDDLLNDLTFYVENAQNSAQGKYYLQPLMVKPKLNANIIEWDVLDGQQRLTTMLLILICLREKLYPKSPIPLYSLSYEKYNVSQKIDFNRITYDSSSPDYLYPDPTNNLDCYYVRKAKDRIERWYDNEISQKQYLQDKFKEMLFYDDQTRCTNSSPKLRAVFIWYNVQPITSNTPSGNRLNDIAVFNRLNRGKISLTDSELIKALFLLCIKLSPITTSSIMSSDTFVRRWDEMGKRLQNDGLWNMIAPKKKEYSNRMDLLFDFIKDCKGSNNSSSYRYYYQEMHSLLTTPNIQKTENLWEEVKLFFDTICKWHDDVHKHNYIGFLNDSGKKLVNIYHDLQKGISLKDQVRSVINISDINDIDELMYDKHLEKIRKILLLFNVLTCDKFNLKFPFDKYRNNSYDVEHVNSQTDNPIDRIDERTEWIREHALACLRFDRSERDTQGFTKAAEEARNLIIEGINLLKNFKINGRDTRDMFKHYRIKVENYYAYGTSSAPSANKDCIGNLTLLNSSINREYKNALFPKKLRILKRSDQEGKYIPLCTKYMFLKYYSNTFNNPSAFSMMRWRAEDQDDYTNAIKETIKNIL